MKYLLLLLLAAPAFAAINDSDLSPTKFGKKRILDTTFTADRIEDALTAQAEPLRLVRMVKGVETEVSGLELKKGNCDHGEMTTVASLQNNYFNIRSSFKTYELKLTLKCGVKQKVIFEEKTNAGQLIGIWQILTKAKNKMEETVGLKYWSHKIPAKFPADSDFYALGVLNLSDGDQWDVITHELGHAIYYMNNIGESAGGEHYIDRCYTEDLALSEGWASFFSAYVNLDLNSVNPAFEYMVPRRAPIQIENVPADVCGKESNEWRVTSFLWDLVDFNRDGESMSRSFQDLWEATYDQKFSSITELKRELIKRDWDKEQLDFIYKLNFPDARHSN